MGRFSAGKIQQYLPTEELCLTIELEKPCSAKTNMIVFDLQCICGCQFEGWFDDRQDFERLRMDGLIDCPHCGSDEIHKLLSPVKTLSCSRPPKMDSTVTENNQEASPEAVVQFFHSVEKFVKDNFEDVGSDLAKEALKMQYGVIEPKNIRGCATEDEEQLLREEGIELIKVPILKKSSDPKPN